MGRNFARLMDVTLRDAGKLNGHRWSRDQAVAVVAACAAAGVPAVEVGYFRPGRQSTDGDTAPAASCPPGYLEALRERSGGARLAVMAGRADLAPADLARLGGTGVTSLAMSAEVGRVAVLAPYARAAEEAGLRLAVKLMRVRGLPDDAILKSAEEAAEYGAPVFYIADSYGAMFPEDARRLGRRLREATGAELGLHAHDGLSLAFANSVAAVEAGFDWIDASLTGLGPDGGNLSLELMVSYLRARATTAIRLAPLADASATVLRPWVGDGAAARATARAADAVIGALDLDPRDRASVGGGSPAALFALLDALPSDGQ